MKKKIKEIEKKIKINIKNPKKNIKDYIIAGQGIIRMIMGALPPL